jgi:NAD(P)H-hydrate epimerase
MTKPPSGQLESAILWLSKQNRPIVSVDVPSGVCSDTGVHFGSAVKASHTFMLTPPRIGLFQPPALEHCGHLETIDIGFPTSFVESVLLRDFPGSSNVRVLEPQNLLKKHSTFRKQDDNKYTTGRVLIVAGSQKYPGAAILAALGCKSVGPGYIVMDTSPETQAALLPLAPDIVFSHNASLQLVTATKQKTSFDAILCGSGLDFVTEKVKACFAIPTRTLILDADALTVLAQETACPSTTADTVITPHEAEFARLFPSLASTLPRTEAAAAAAKQSRAIVVLKGPRTIIAHPNGEVFINTQSTPALARAGTGDVLAGMIAAFASQRMSAFEAAQCAVWLHSQRALQIETELSAAQCDALRLATAPASVD